MNPSAALLLVALLAGACSKQAPSSAPNTVQTVKAFKTHETERDTVIAACKAAQDIAEQQDPQCDAAMTAAEQVAREAYARSRRIPPDRF